MYYKYKKVQRNNKNTHIIFYRNFINLSIGDTSVFTRQQSKYTNIDYSIDINSAFCYNNKTGDFAKVLHLPYIQKGFDNPYVRYRIKNKSSKQRAEQRILRYSKGSS